MNGRRLANSLALTLALTIAVGASGAGPATADPAASVTVVATVYAAGAAPATDQTTVGALEAGCPLYTGPSPEQYGTGGADAPAINPSASWSIGTLISQCLQQPQIPLTSVSGVTIIGPDGSPQLDSGAQLSQADLQTPSDFQNSSESPVLSDDGDGIIYERPSRGGSDDNAADVITTNAPGSFELQIFTGPLLSVTASASTNSVAADTPVTFSASVAGSPDDVSYSWDFAGAAPAATGASTTASFSTPGIYGVSVEATDADGGGGYGEVQVTVGAPTPSTGTTTTGPTHTSGGAPRGTRGKRKHRAPAKPKPKPKTKPKAKKRPVQRVRTGVPPTPASTTTVPGASVVGTVKPIAVQPSGGPSVGGVRRPAHEHPAQGKKPPATGPAATATKPRGVRVAGRLLGGVVAVAPGRSELSAATGSAPRLRVGSATTALGFAAAAAAALLLLGLGAARELRNIRLRP